MKNLRLSLSLNCSASRMLPPFSNRQPLTAATKPRVSKHEMVRTNCMMSFPMLLCLLIGGDPLRRWTGEAKLLNALCRSARASEGKNVDANAPVHGWIQLVLQLPDQEIRCSPAAARNARGLAQLEFRDDVGVHRTDRQRPLRDGGLGRRRSACVNPRSTQYPAQARQEARRDEGACDGRSEAYPAKRAEI